MIPLSSATSGGLTWSRLSRTRSYELKVNDQVVGTLQHPSFWSSSFVAESQSGRWIFRRGGWFGAGSEILDSSSQQQLATFKSVWGGSGTLTFSDGQQFQLECNGWRRPVWSVVGKGGETVLRLHTREKTVDGPNVGSVPDTRLSVLIMFTWYRVLQAEEDAAATAVAAAS
jgi:hypothetical protein